MKWGVGRIHKASQETLTHAVAGVEMGQPLQDDGKGPVMMFMAYPKPSPHGSSQGVDLLDASEEASPGSPETGKVTDVVTITLDAQDSAAKCPQPPSSRGTDGRGMCDLLPQRFLTLCSQSLVIFFFK